MVYKLKSNASILLPTLLCLDFHKPLPHPEVQFSSLPYHFWTSACFSAASKSIPPLFLVLFGLLHTVSPLQSPIRHFPSLRLDFRTLSLCFKVQSATFPRSVWTFAHCPTASKSIPPLLYHDRKRSTTVLLYLQVIQTGFC